MVGSDFDLATWLSSDAGLSHAGPGKKGCTERRQLRVLGLLIMHSGALLGALLVLYPDLFMEDDSMSEPRAATLTK